MGLAAIVLSAWACGGGTTDPDPPRSNNPPVATGAIPAQAVQVGQTVTVNLSQYFNDPDGDALTYAAQAANANVATVSVSGSSATVAGVSKGNTTITVTASDPDGLTAQQSFVVDVPNRTPEAVGNIADLDLLAGDTVGINVSGNFNDPDGDALTYDAATSDEGVATAAIEGATVTVIAVADGNASITVTASDPGGLSAQQSFSANVDPPGNPRVQFLADPVAVLEGETFLVEVEARPPPESTLEVGYSIGGDDDPRTHDADVADHDGGRGGTVRFEAGSRRATLEIAVRDDDDVDPTREVLGFTLDTPQEGAGYILGSTTVALVTIEEGVCDRTPRVRDELMFITGVFRCHEMDGTHLAAIDTIDLRGPEPGVPDVAPDLRRSQGSGNRYCGLETNSFSRERSSEIPVPVLPRCLPAAHVRMAPAPPPSIANTPAGDAITELRAGDFSELTELKELWLFDNDLTELPAGIFSELTELRVLILDRNRLKELPEGLLSGLSRLEIFAAVDNDLTRLPPGLFSGLSRLESLWLYQNELAELPAASFSDLHDLEGLYLWENRLDALPAGILAELGRLKVLSLGTNRLTELDAAVFSELGDLEELDLLANRLTELPPGVFANLGSLEVMYLNENRLQGLPKGLFEGLPSLVTLSLNGNRIAEIESGAFAGLSGLEVIDLHENHLATLNSGAFAGLSGLEQLYLNDNRLVVLDLGVFSGLSSLQLLWLGDNRILDLEPGVFDGLSSLQQLALGGNPFTELERDVFAGLSRLDELWLENGELTALHPGTFNGLSGLTQLFIFENQLATLESGAFTGLPALVELWLSSNQIKDLSDDVFAELRLLRKLVVERNRLTELPPGVFSELTRLEELFISNNQLAGLSPDIFSSLGGLKALIANTNNLSELTDRVFTGLSELVQLDLDFNPGTPFILDVQLERTDTTDLAAPGPAKVVLSLAEGAPFPMTIPLAVEGGTLSTTVAVIERGESTSAEFTVTMTASSGTEVVLGPTPPVPEAMVGVHLVAADTLVLFTTSGDASDAEPDVAARLEEPGSGTGDLAPLILAAGLLGSARLRLRPHSRDRGGRSRTGCSAGGGRCRLADHDR